MSSTSAIESKVIHSHGATARVEKKTAAGSHSVSEISGHLDKLANNNSHQQVQQTSTVRPSQPRLRSATLLLILINKNQVAQVRRVSPMANNGGNGGIPTGPISPNPSQHGVAARRPFSDERGQSSGAQQSPAHGPFDDAAVDKYAQRALDAFFAAQAENQGSFERPKTPKRLDRGQPEHSGSPREAESSGAQQSVQEQRVRDDNNRGSLANPIVVDELHATADKTNARRRKKRKEPEAQHIQEDSPPVDPLSIRLSPPNPIK
ncbi:hypothetical protein FZEAL_4471, partial [Fusarium zealandicum]